ncbi:MAG: hypothetical protein V7785_15575 [Bermanella sp.]
MNKLVWFVIFNVVALGAWAEPRRMHFQKAPVYANDTDKQSNLHLSKKESKNEEGDHRFQLKEEKSVLPIVLSVSFLAMSLYGDNPSSGTYRAIGSIATIGSFSWYFE